MEKIKSLDRYQKGVLIFMIAMALVFSVVYPMIISQVGFEYNDTIFVPSQENGSTVYSGKIQGQQAYFTVSEDKTVVFQHGDKTYGPYTAKEEPTAIPRNENGDVIDSVEPSASAILELMNDPELTHKGEWFAWFGAVFICVLNAISILFADELFRWNLAFQIRNVDHAEPSDWEIAGRYIGWTVLPIMALVLFIMGLQ